MIFRFSRYPQINEVIFIENFCRGIRYREQSPTSVELDLSELQKLLDVRNESLRDNLLVTLSHKTERLENAWKTYKSLNEELSKFTHCKGCKNQSSANDIEGLCLLHIFQININDEFYSECDKKE